MAHTSSHPRPQVLYDLQTRLRNHPSFLAPSISEPSLRKYQVLPGRTHPEMNGLPHGGYILQVTRVFDLIGANSVASGKKAHKKRKVDEPPTSERPRGDRARDAQVVEGDDGKGEPPLPSVSSSVLAQEATSGRSSLASDVPAEESQAAVAVTDDADAVPMEQI
jgi:tRNA (adenine-N(1)-)-methyltransferase non-catalytic subunit